MLSVLLPAMLLQYTPEGNVPGPLEDRFNQCFDTAVEDAASGVLAANEWLIKGGGGYFARQCLGFAYTRQQRWEAAETTFAEAAREAEQVKDSRAANLWAQAGNAALAGDHPEQAIAHFNAALAQGSLTGMLLGEVHLDRGRARVAAGNTATAMSDFDLAHEHVPEDPLGWLLSATLARRLGDLDRAQADIEVAAKLGPRDAEIGLEAGNIAAVSGNYAAARKSWEQVVALAPESPMAKTAQSHLDQLAAIESESAQSPGGEKETGAVPADQRKDGQRQAPEG